MSTPHPSPAAAGTATPHATGQKGIILKIFFGFIFLLLVWFIFFNSSDQKSENTIKDNNQPGLRGTVTMVKEVTFTGEYSETFYISDGMNFSFFDATQSYCAMNKDNHEECGNKGEDVSYKFGTKNASNREIKFKSQNGQPGSIKILLVSRN